MIGLGEQDHLISNITAGGVHLPVYQDPQEAKKRRNRLAQRKHRETPKKSCGTSSNPLEKAKVSVGLRASTISNSSQHDAPDETSVHCRTSSLPEKLLTQHQSEASINHIHYTTYQSGEIVSAMDFPLPGSPESLSDTTQLPDLEQHLRPTSEASFDNVGTAFLAEDLGMRQDLVAQAYKGFMSQNDSSMVYEMPQQQPPQCQPQVAQPSHTRAEAEVSRPLPQTHHPFPSTQPSRTRAEAEVSRPLLQTHHFFPPAMSTSNITRKSSNSFVAPNSDPVSSGENNDQTNSDRSSHTRCEADTESNSAQSGLPETPDSIPDAEDLEARFESIIRAVEEAGFKSIDDMSAQYYTATFKEDTVSHWAQSRSRSRSLHAFLASLHASTNNWSDREVQGYRQQITEAAESLYVSELSYAKEGMMQNEDRRSQALGEKASSPISQTAMSVQRLWQMIADMELSQDFKQKKTMVREKVSFSVASLDLSLHCQPTCALIKQLIQGVVDAGNLVTSG
ncbi:MAG: hypothetical protein Q9161_009008 [Pseudevernia consocians]